MFLSRPFPLLALSLVLLRGVAASSSNTPSRKATYKLSNECSSPIRAWDTILPDICIPILDSGYGTLQVRDPWPICANGTEAKLAFFWLGSKTCDPSDGNFNTFATKKETIGTCNLLMLTGSLGFWCDGIQPLPSKPPTKEEAAGGVVKHIGKECDKKNKPEPEMHAPDTCIDINEGFAVEFSMGATCRNRTKAAIVGFKGKGCDPTNEPLQHPATIWQDTMIGQCVPTKGIQSMMFWCDGINGLDLTKPFKENKGKSNFGLILGLSLGLVGGVLAIIGGFILAYNTNWHFRSWVQERFDRGNGYIAL